MKLHIPISTLNDALKLHNCDPKLNLSNQGWIAACPVEGCEGDLTYRSSDHYVEYQCSGNSCRPEEICERLKIECAVPTPAAVAAPSAPIQPVNKVIPLQVKEQDVCKPSIRPQIPKSQTMLEIMESEDFFEPPQTIQCGWQPFDCAQPFGGIECGTLAVIAAPPGCYKTGIMLRIARGFAEQGQNIHWLAAEMRPNQLVKRSICQAVGLPLNAMWSKKDADRKTIAAAQKRLAPALSRLTVVRAPIGFDEIRAAADIAPIVFIDYLQKIRHPEPRMARHEQLEEIMSFLAELSQSNNSVFILASSQSRGNDSERGIANATKGSSAIEYTVDALYCAKEPSVEETQCGNFEITYGCLKQREGERLALKVRIKDGRIVPTDDEWHAMSGAHG